MLNDVVTQTQNFISSIPKNCRKKYGQFFTSESCAGFMASLFNIDIKKKEFNILDAGAGTGILSAAIIDRLISAHYKGKISLVCYETDLKVMPILKDNLERLKEDCNLVYTIRQENYITSQSFSPSLFQVENEKFDIIIGNPPYMKIAKDAPEALVMRDVCYGAPNLYFLFWSMGILNLKPDCELVYIVPRSWTSGLYFDYFRKYLFSECVITHIHLFESREKVFDGESVLQETMIVKIKKTKIKPAHIEITSSTTSDFFNLNSCSVPYDTVVASNSYVYLVTNTKEAEVLNRMNHLTDTLPSINLKMRTGLIVDFRAKNILRNENEVGSFPLFYSQHIKDGKIVWPQGRSGEYIHTNHFAYLQKNSNYLFVKRFTSKEERRRLQCGIYLSSEYPEYKYISTQNKINFIQCESKNLVFGLYVLLNSSLYDDYYRILNGSTQVNSTEVNSMPVPKKTIIESMGRELMGKDLSERNCNTIIDKWIR